MKRLCLTLILCATFAVPARAEADANSFLRAIDNGDKVLLRVLDGYANGFLWANAFLAREKSKPLFCAPEKLSVTADQNADILRKHIRLRPSDGELPAGLALMLAYKGTFPC